MLYTIVALIGIIKLANFVTDEDAVERLLVQWDTVLILLVGTEACVVLASVCFHRIPTKTDSNSMFEIPSPSSQKALPEKV